MEESRTLLSADGDLQPESLQNFPFSSDDAVSVMCVFSAHGLSQSNFLDSLLGTSLASATDRHGIEAAFVPADDSGALAETGPSLIVLDVEQFDGRDRSRAEAREKASHLALCLSDVVMFLVRMQDLARVESSGLSALHTSFAELLRLQASETLPARAGKRAFIVVVHDFEDEVLTRDELITGFMEQLEAVYANAAKPARAPARAIDVFDFEFVTLPHRIHCEEEYGVGVEGLYGKLCDPAVDEFLFENGDYSRPAGGGPIASTATAAWGALAQAEETDLPAPKELSATFDCDGAMRAVFDKYRRGVRGWRRETDGGAVIDGFGDASAKLIVDTVAVFEHDARAYRGSRAFRRKRDELKALLDADLYELFVAQVAKLRETTYRAFKDALDDLADADESIERKVASALKDCQRGFKTSAERLRPRRSAWRFDNEMKELAAQMRDDATNRIQVARLAEYHENGGQRRRRRAPRRAVGGKARQPISVSFHYLDPAPFGIKDSRYEKLSVDDSVKYVPPPRNSKAVVGGKNEDEEGVTIPLLPARGEPWNKFG